MGKFDVKIADNKIDITYINGEITKTGDAVFNVGVRIKTRNELIDLINKIKQHPNLVSFFCENSKTEVPVAGTVNGRFISRRIDRMCVNHDTKIVDIIDYKTDTCCDTYHDKYVSQVHEYIKLVQQIYPEYKIKGYILWTHNFFLETV